MKKLKIVVVAHEIYPRIAPRSFRATELAKALSKKGHEVTLLASLGNFNYSDFQNKYKIKVKDLGTSIFATSNSNGSIKLPLWKLGLIFFLRKATEFPQICLLNKVKNGIKEEGVIDLLITVAVPYPVHWGAAMISKTDRKFTTWVSDCGDPFMFNSLKKPFFYFKYLEKYWSKKTDHITVPIATAKESYYPEFEHKIDVIPQGFNFDEIKLTKYIENAIPTFIYAGMFYPDKRDPTSFLEYLTTLDVDFKFIIYTQKTALLLPFIKQLKGKMEIRNSINRDDLIVELSSKDFLINIKNKGITNQSPSKLIDYSLTKRPVLELSSDFSEIEKESFNSFLKGDYTNSCHIKDLSPYNALNVADQFIKLHERHG